MYFITPRFRAFSLPPSVLATMIHDENDCHAFCRIPTVIEGSL